MIGRLKSSREPANKACDCREYRGARMPVLMLHGLATEIECILKSDWPRLFWIDGRKQR